MFDVMISPILMYNSEVLGVYLKPDFDHWDKSQIEKVHRRCKSYLKVIIIIIIIIIMIIITIIIKCN